MTQDTLTTLPTIHSATVPTLQTSTTIPTLNKLPITQTINFIPNKLGAIPISESKISLVKNGSYKPSKITDEENSNGTDSTNTGVTDEEEEAYTITKFKELKSFKPTTLPQQLHEVCFLGFRDLADELLEQALNVMAGEEGYEWTCIEEVDAKVVFVRVLDEDTTVVAQTIKGMMGYDGLQLRGMTLRVGVEQNTKKFVEDTLKDSEETPIDLDEAKSKLNKIMDRSGRKTYKALTDLDYVIDETELTDIPKEALPQLKIDIKEFRLKALENEKKKREKEALEDKRRAKLQLRKLFEKFRSETDGAMDVDDDDDDEESDKEDDGLTDEQYEELRVKKENDDMLKRFASKLHLVNVQERRNAELIKELEELKNYEANLNKTPTSQFRPSGRSKSRELEDDEKDREEEKLDNKAQEESEKFLASINIPLKVSLAPNADGETETETETDADALMVDDERLDAILEEIKPKISGYVNEALGVEEGEEGEEELSEIIASIIKEERNKKALLEELEEPLGDDAKTVTDSIWADIQSLV